MTAPPAIATQHRPIGIANEVLEHAMQCGLVGLDFLPADLVPLQLPPTVTCRHQVFVFDKECVTDHIRVLKCGIDVTYPEQAGAITQLCEQIENPENQMFFQYKLFIKVVIPTMFGKSQQALAVEQLA